MQRSFYYLGIHGWSVFAELSAYTEPCICDLRKVLYVYPPGIVGLILMLHKRAGAGLPTEIMLPQNSDVLNYLERVDFLSKLPDDVKLDQDVSFLAYNQRNQSDYFSELLTPTNIDFDQVKNVIWSFLEREVSGEVHPIFGAFEEVLQNIQDHSDPSRNQAAYYCIQVQVYQGAIELAFGDLGVGFLATLRRNPELLHLQNEVSALRGALLYGYSRFAHEKVHRGGGLRRASQIIVNRFGGKFKVLSQNGEALQSQTDGQKFETTQHAFPGTLVWMYIPRLT